MKVLTAALGGGENVYEGVTALDILAQAAYHPPDLGLKANIERYCEQIGVIIYPKDLNRTCINVLDYLKKRNNLKVLDGSIYEPAPPVMPWMKKCPGIRRFKR